jgi:hypothetical protein
MTNHPFFVIAGNRVGVDLNTFKQTGLECIDSILIRWRRTEL